MAIQNKNSLNSTKLKAFFHFAIQKWWIIYGLSLAIIAVALLGHPPTAIDEIIFYPWIIMREKAGLFISILLGVIILGSMLYGMKKQFVILPLLLFVVTSVVALAAFGPYVGRIINNLDPDPRLTHVASIRTNEHIYNLARHDAFYEALGQAYVFYDCDSLGINCRAIYRYKPTSLEDAYADIDNPAFISSDNTTIAVHIAGKVVYTLPISTDS